MPEKSTEKKSSKPEYIIDISGLKVYFPIHGGLLLRKVGEIKAVDGVSFRIKAGETLGLVGESGCGKTTVGKSIINLVKPTGGQVVFSTKSGERVDLARLTRSQMRPYRANIQMIFQDPYSSLNPRMSVGAIIEEPLRIHNPKMKTREREDRVAWLLEKVGLTGEQASRYPHEFSGGQRQRVGVARPLPQIRVLSSPMNLSRRWMSQYRRR